MRDLRPQVDRFGNISVEVTIGRGDDPWYTGANAKPRTVAEFLRDLATEIEILEGGE